MIKSTVKKLYLALIFIFLYAPIATLIVLSLIKVKPGQNGEALP